MKPAHCKQVDVNCDISPWTLTRYIDKLTEANRERLSNKREIVKVSAQSLEYMVPVAYALSLTLEIDVNYQVDEWSVEMTIYETTDGKFSSETQGYWSPGA